MTENGAEDAFAHFNGAPKFQEILGDFFRAVYEARDHGKVVIHRSAPMPDGRTLHLFGVLGEGVQK